jgi:hypothetical protein
MIFIYFYLSFYFDLDICESFDFFFVWGGGVFIFGSVIFGLLLFCNGGSILVIGFISFSFYFYFYFYFYFSRYLFLWASNCFGITSLKSSESIFFFLVYSFISFMKTSYCNSSDAEGLKLGFFFIIFLNYCKNTYKLDLNTLNT